MRVYFDSENEHEWNKEGYHFGGKVKLTRKEYDELCRKNGTTEFGYNDGTKSDRPGREIRFTNCYGGLTLCYLLGINYRRMNYCIEIR